MPLQKAINAAWKHPNNSKNITNKKRKAAEEK